MRGRFSPNRNPNPNPKQDCPNPSAENVCYTCGKPGHTSRYCRNGPAAKEVDTAHIEELVTRRGQG